MKWPFMLTRTYHTHVDKLNLVREAEAKRHSDELERRLREADERRKRDFFKAQRSVSEIVRMERDRVTAAVRSQAAAARGHVVRNAILREVQDGPTYHLTHPDYAPAKATNDTSASLTASVSSATPGPTVEV